MQKQENFLFKGHRSIFCIKVPFGIGHPPPTHQIQSICVWEGSGVPNLQMEFNYLDSFKSYCIFCDFVVPTCSPHCPHCPHIVPIVPTSSLSSPEGPHVVPTPPMAVVSIVSTTYGWVDQWVNGWDQVKSLKIE